MQFLKEIFSVSELTLAIKKNLESSFSIVSVKGEVSNLKVQSSGHVYFTLKDKDAQIFCALFRLDASRIKKLPKDGDLLVARGEISVFPPKGSYQLIVRTLQFEGLGDLLLEFQKRKEKLSSLGWFDLARKKKIPKFPKIIGVVTSPTGAVIQDILHVLSRRYAGFHLILNPVPVQGEGAAVQIAKAIQDFNTHKLCDVLIIGRGGGSLEDLWAFNEECVAEAIFNSTIPVISAVGHETDFSISDFVADIRAPTPSAAAEIATCDKNQELSFLATCARRLEQTLFQKIAEKKSLFFTVKKRPEFSTAAKLLKDRYLMLDQMEERLKTLSPLRKLGLQKELLERMKKQLSLALTNKYETAIVSWKNLRVKERLTSSFSTSFSSKKDHLIQLIRHLISIDPKNLLKKGYAIVFNQKTSSVILSSHEIRYQDMLTIRFHDGAVAAKAQEVPSDTR